MIATEQTFSFVTDLYCSAVYLLFAVGEILTIESEYDILTSCHLDDSYGILLFI